jgi:hypothetical protein
MGAMAPFDRQMKRRGRAQPGSRFITEPRSISALQAAGGVILGQPMTDTARVRDALRRGLIQGMPPVEYPNDDLLIATLVEHGQPLFAANELRYHPGARLFAYIFWDDVQQAAKGNPEAKEVVEAAMMAWAQMRKDEIISDRPEHTAGFWER